MYFWGGRPFLTGAVSEIRSRAPGMMLLIGLAITVAFVSSWGASLGVLDHQLDFWWELALLIVIMLLGHWIEMRSLAQTSSALDSLAALLPDEAERVEGDERSSRSPRRSCGSGDVVIVRPGGSVPADGEIVDGAADINESMVTGESVPVRRGVGDHVVAGTVATDSGLRVKVTAVGDDTALAGIQRLVTEAQNSSSRAQRLADIAAGWLFWFALGAAVITAVVWGVVGRPEDAVIRTITVLVIACPHALGSGDTAGGVHRHRTRGARRRADQGPARAGKHADGRRRAVRQDRHPDQGRAERDGRGRDGRAQRREVLALAAAAETDSEHPLARAIVAAAEAATPEGARVVGLFVVARGRGDRDGRRPTGPRRRSAAAGTRPGRPSCPTPRHGTAKARSCCTSLVDGAVAGALQAGRRSPAGVAAGGRRACTGWASRS